jgi:putative endonuclease
MMHFVYIMAKARNSTMYVGMTRDLAGRIQAHKEEFADGFTKKYGIKTLVYYEAIETFEAALFREKQLKKWRRQSKMELIEKMNPDWQDLYDRICQ